MAANLNRKTFEEMVTKGKGVALVDFWAPWCGPCKMMEPAMPCRQQVPIVDKLADEVSKRAFVGKVNVEEETILSKMFDIVSIPTLIVFKNGKVVDRMSGLHTMPQLIEAIDKQL